MIILDVEKLKNKSKEILLINGDFIDTLNKLDNYNKDLSEVWCGQSFENFVEEYQNFKIKARTFSEKLVDYGRKIEIAIAEFTNTDKELSNNCVSGIDAHSEGMNVDNSFSSYFNSKSELFSIANNKSIVMATSATVLSSMFISVTFGPFAPLVNVAANEIVGTSVLYYSDDNLKELHYTRNKNNIKGVPQNISSEIVHKLDTGDITSIEIDGLGTVYGKNVESSIWQADKDGWHWVLESCHELEGDSLKLCNNDGSKYELVYRVSDGNIVLFGPDKGTYNIGSPDTEKGAHFNYDLLPWYLFGNDETDKKSIDAVCGRVLLSLGVKNN